MVSDAAGEMVGEVTIIQAIELFAAFYFLLYLASETGAKHVAQLVRRWKR